MAENRVWVAGHLGMVGSAVARRLANGSCEVLTVVRQTLDLRDQGKVLEWMRANRPDAIFLATANSGQRSSSRGFLDG